MSLKIKCFKKLFFTTIKENNSLSEKWRKQRKEKWDWKLSDLKKKNIPLQQKEKKKKKKDQKSKTTTSANKEQIKEKITFCEQ